MSSCNHDCSSCKEKCEKSSFLAMPKDSTKIGKMIAVLVESFGIAKGFN